MAEASALGEPLGDGTVVDSDPVGLRGAVLGGETDPTVGHRDHQERYPVGRVCYPLTATIASRKTVSRSGSAGSGRRSAQTADDAMLRKGKKPYLAGGQSPLRTDHQFTPAMSKYLRSVVALRPISRQSAS